MGRGGNQCVFADSNLKGLLDIQVEVAGSSLVGGPGI